MLLKDNKRVLMEISQTARNMYKKEYFVDKFGKGQNDAGNTADMLLECNLKTFPDMLFFRGLF